LKTEPLGNAVNFGANPPEPQLYGEDLYGNHNNSNNNNNGEGRRQDEEVAPRVMTEQGFTGTVGIKEDG